MVFQQTEELMALSAEDQIRLTNFQAARDALISGQATAAFEYNGQRTEYSKADLTRLDAEIDRLTVQKYSPGLQRRGAITFRL
jgi:hypothetical protein